MFIQVAIEVVDCTRKLFEHFLSLLLQGYLSRVRFRAPDGGLVAFDENGDPPAE